MSANSVPLKFQNFPLICSVLRFIPLLTLGAIATLGLPSCKRAAPTPPAATKSIETGPTPTIAAAVTTEVPPDAPPAKFNGIVQARIDKGYAAVTFADGHKRMLPLAGMPEAERDWLQNFAGEHPYAHSNSTVTISHAAPKKTIVRQTMEGTTEVVQLCPPNVLRDQIGGTCALYANVHYLDIAGYPLADDAIYKVIDKSPRENPWLDPQYRVRMDRLFTDMVPAPILHSPRNAVHPFEWAREQLRLGRPVMAALPEDIWQALPASFLATHPWDGAKTGHAVVINGFTLDPANPKKNSFHVINSWRELSEFDVPADVAAKNVVAIVQSISSKGEIQAAAVQVVIKQITQVSAVGKQFLFAVETNVGTRRVVASSEEAARRLIENENQPNTNPAPI